MRLLYIDENGEGVLVEGDDVTIELLDQMEREFWLDIPLNHPIGIDLLENYFRFHPLTVEDAVEPGTRTKIDFFDHYLFLVSYSIERPIDKDDTEFKYVYRDISFYMGRGFLVTIRDPHARFIDSYLAVTPTNVNLLKEGTDYILHSIMDNLVDGYLPILNDIEKQLDDIENAVLENDLKKVTEKVFKQRRRLAGLKRRVLPMRDVLRLLVNVAPRSEIIDDELVYLFQDVYDHTQRLVDVWDSEHHTASEIMETYSNLMDQRMNRIMKMLTIISTIMLPLTLITGIYGMNFVNMPELVGTYSYFIVLGVMAFIAVSLIVIIRIWGWFK